MNAELIGHYRVVGTLGSGGMGVVSKAIDTRLNRPVALKAIRDAGNTDAVLRLRAEALAAASLDHPYICKIYELLETGAATIVVMEYVEGETLGDILARRTPALVDTLRYGSEIAEGLANAHARGLVHRDVKPSNVMVTPHNHIKLLDFGIARITAEAALTQSGLTLPGNTPGTPQYMAPEQALGRPVDGRADLFSLGVLLFRCLAGQLPFEGATRDEYVQQMLAGRMRPLDQLAPAAPEQVRAIVKSCLDRDPARRPESATVVSDTLRRAADALSTGTLPIVQRASRAIPRWLMQLSALALAAAAVGLAFYRWRSLPADESGSRTLVPVVTWPSAESEGLISPDGKWLSFISDKQNQSRVFVQSIESGNAVPVSLPGAAISHVWSQDGREIAAVVRQTTGHFLVVVPAFFGGSPRVSVLLDQQFNDLILRRWIGDGVYIDVARGQRGRALVRASLTSGRVDDISSAWPRQVRYLSLDLSQESGAIVMDAVIDGRSDLWTAKTDGSDLQPLTRDAFVERRPLWVAPDIVAFESNRGGQMDLWQLSTTTKRATQLTSSLMVEVPTGASSDGTVAFQQLDNSVNLWHLGLKSGTTRQLTGDALSDYWPTASADGTRVAFQRARPTPAEGWELLDARVLVAPQTGSGALEAQPVADGFGARISPDGSWVAYYQRLPVPKRLRLLVKNLSTGEVRTLSEDCILPFFTASQPVDWIGQHATWGSGTDIYFLVQGEGREEIHQADMRTPAKTSVLVAAPAETALLDLRVAPDGRSLAYLVRTSKDPKSSKEGERAVDLHIRSLSDNSDSVIAREPGPVAEVFLSGWTHRNSLIVQRAKASGGGAYAMQLTEVALDGSRRPVATLGDSFPSTVRLDPARGRLFVTRAFEGIHNLHLLTLADGKMRQLTSNDSPGVSFSGIHPQGEGAIVFARDERRRDIWLVQRKLR